MARSSKYGWAINLHEDSFRPHPIITSSSVDERLTWKPRITSMDHVRRDCRLVFNLFKEEI